MYIQRNAEKVIRELVKEYPVLMVLGARQVGKSTLLNHIKEEKRLYVTLDDFNARNLALTDPLLFLQTYPAPVIIDEFQYAPDLLTAIKLQVDKRALKNEHSEALYWLTGSQTFAMMKHVSETLAGRAGIIDLSSLSKSEIEGRDVGVFHPAIEQLKQRSIGAIKKDVHQIYQMIFNGGMPKLIAEDLSRDAYYSNYVRTYVERDVQQLSQVGNVSAFYNFLTYTAARTAQTVDYATTAKAIGVSAPTIKQWISILERSGLIYLLQPYFNDISSRLVKAPKLYFMDTGLCAWLCKWPTPETLEHGAMDGAFFETFAVSEIIKSFYNAGKRVNLYYYRDRDQKEIDLLYIEGNDVYPIEIKKGIYPSMPDRNFDVLNKYKLNIQTAIVLCMSEELVPLNKKVWYCPISIL